MILTLVKLKELLLTLDEARRESIGSGNGHYCDQPLTDDAGNDYRWEMKPLKHSNRQLVPRRAGEKLVDGTLVEEMPNGAPGIKVKLGVHGRAFLGIDPETGEVCCAKCKGGD